MRNFVHCPRTSTGSRSAGPHVIAPLSLLLATVGSLSAVAQTDYCVAQGQSTSYEHIASVEVGGVLVATGNDNGYAAPASGLLQLETGPNGLTLSPGFRYGSYTERWAVFVDLDHSGTYETSELLYSGGSREDIHVTLTVPDEATRGATGMRVLMRYGSTPSACGTFYYGEVEDYVVNIVGPEELGQVATTTLIGFDEASDQQLAIVGRFARDGVVYSSSSFFSPTIGWSRERTLNVDVGTEIEWSAVVPATGEHRSPTACAVVVGDTCRTLAGSVGEVVEFDAPSPAVIPDPPTGDLLLTFDDMFGGITYQPGPSYTIDDVTLTTTGSYFYNLSDAPFSSGYLAFIDLQMTFPAAVASVSFDYEGRCANCIQTVTLSADGAPVQTFDAQKDVLSNITIPLPPGTTVLEFDENIGIDNMVVSYQ